ncbi:hypothetical protein LNTAR_12316 [Lentisphaera araneosa HTCC2155]|uniref:Uncharacterized protein n=1 Tax=Lentisphaera araneosa HTCC2155 TaxID=313628 RepID=A6DJR4_9BACT|nr:hypothetical protein LNTAR_12316 [Lentisphaera araneosa HTCC2155]
MKKEQLQIFEDSSIRTECDSEVEKWYDLDHRCHCDLD